MALEKSILKSDHTDHVFDYKPKEFSKAISSAAVAYVRGDDQRSKDFLISDLASQQSGVQKLEEERNRGLVNDQVLEKLKEVQEKAYREAYDLGHLEGKNAAFAEEKERLKGRLVSLDQLLLSVDTLKSDLLKVNEAQLVELTFQIGKRIALRDVSQNRDVINELIRQVISDLQSEQKIVVHACAADIAILEDLGQRTEVESEAMKKMKFVTDPEIQPGGCLIDLEYGQINLTLPDRVERVWQALEKQVGTIQKSET